MRRLSLRLQGRAPGTPAPHPDAAQEARSDRGGMRELRRAAPPGRWPQRGKAGDCPLLGRRPSRGLSRAAALPSPRRRRQAAVPATARPVVTRRYAALSTAMRNRPCRHCGTARDQPRNVTACTVRASPLKPAQRLSGGRLRPRQGRAFGASLSRWRKRHPWPDLAASPPDPMAPVGL